MNLSVDFVEISMFNSFSSPKMLVKCLSMKNTLQCIYLFIYMKYGDCVLAELQDIGNYDLIHGFKELHQGHLCNFVGLIFVCLN